MQIKMNRIYSYLGISRQAFHQRLDRELQQEELKALLVPIIEELRLEHPGVGARKLYLILRPRGIGRDRFEQLCFAQGLKLEYKRQLRRTTNSGGVIRFPDLVAGREFTAVNQAWASDITYIEVGGEVYYLTFVLDVYSRKIVGHSVSKWLSTEHTTLPALTWALRNRHPDTGLILHSDGGGQYYSKRFLRLTGLHGICNSMCSMAYENPYAERINGTIKNQYIKGYDPQNFKELVAMTRRAVNNYNKVRPHSSLNGLTPEAFENILPAGGSLLLQDNFLSKTIQAQLQRKNYLVTIRPTTVTKTKLKK